MTPICASASFPVSESTACNSSGVWSANTIKRPKVGALGDSPGLLAIDLVVDRVLRYLVQFLADLLSGFAGRGL